MKYLFILPIRFYQRFISPLIGPHCRFYPTCSCYAVEAYQKHGVIKGTILTVWRIVRCNPFCKGGIDPVPETFLDFRKKQKSNGDD